MFFGTLSKADDGHVGTHLQFKVPFKIINAGYRAKTDFFDFFHGASIKELDQLFRFFELFLKRGLDCLR